jgi:hypothetical protein
MKSSNQPSFYFSPISPKTQNQELSPKTAEQSPYLRAILSEKRIAGTGRILSLADSTLEAALRYIASNRYA